MADRCSDLLDRDRARQVLFVCVMDCSLDISRCSLRGRLLFDFPQNCPESHHVRITTQDCDGRPRPITNGREDDGNRVTADVPSVVTEALSYNSLVERVDGGREA